MNLQNSSAIASLQNALWALKRVALPHSTTIETNIVFQWLLNEVSEKCNIQMLAHVA